MTVYAFYDLDRTITRLPTWSAFLLFAAARDAPHRLALVPMAGAAALGYRLGLIGRDRLKEIMHGLMLGRHQTPERIASISERFAERVSERNIRPGALAQIAADRAAGYRIVLATAAHRFYAEAIARRLEITDVIATEAALADGGALTHRLHGANVYGAAKLAAVEAWLAAIGTPRRNSIVRFYTDHASDAPCLAFSDEPFAVNPDRRLHALAVANGWRILDWQRAPNVLGDSTERKCTP